MREMRWTDEQADAITAEGHLLLAASAGTGKTTTVVARILWLLGLDVGVRDGSGERLAPCPDPCRLEEIAAITFTEKAGYDLKSKLRSEIGRSEAAGRLRWEIDRASVGTIHAFCAELLREHALRLGIDPTFRILDERETRLQQEEIIREVLLGSVRAEEPGAVQLVKRFGLDRQGRRRGAVDHVGTALRDIRWRASRYEAWTRSEAGERKIDLDALGRLAREAGIAVGDPPDPPGFDFTQALYGYARGALRRWLDRLEEENLRDFDSLILDARRLLTRPETRPALREIRGRYRILIIDEFQDTDTAQRDIAFAIGGVGDDGRRRAGGPSLFLVGDPKQSIYRFRGADISVWSQVNEALCGDEEPSRLTHNFRSEPLVVDFVNRVCAPAMTECAEATAEERLESRVDYTRLEPWRRPTDAAAVEWLAIDRPVLEASLAETEALMVASRIRDLVGAVPVIDPESGARRPCAFRDIAVLGRKRADLAAIERGLRRYEIPSYNSATGGLGDRQEILDLATALKVIENPQDDYHVFGFLRSPFVGLRDEVLARIRLDPVTKGGPLIRQAERFLAYARDEPSAWYPAPEGDRIGEIERRALARGLRVIREAHALVDRAEAGELLEEILERTGYRLHLLLRDGAAEALANIERFQALLEEYRHLPLREFLELWDQWGESDLGIPQAPLFSREDDVVTLSTIHTAKGLEWPIVFLVRTEGKLRSGGVSTYDFWSDRELGPVFTLTKAERGDRANRLLAREELEETAEEARLLYVAMTRARDRLIVAGPTEEPNGYARWLAVGLDDAVEAHEAPRGEPAVETAERPSRPGPGRGRPGEADDLTTGTGRQIDAFGMDDAAEDGDGQFNLFAPPPPAEGSSREDPAIVGRIEPIYRPVVVHRQPAPIQSRLAEPPLSLAWLEEIVPTDPPRLVAPVEAPVLRFTTSATERMMKEKDPEAWERRYRHGVIPLWQFAPSGEPALSAPLRGTVIHGVLERIQELEDLSAVLNETIAGIDSPELESLLAPGTPYREALEAEIAAVVRSSEWAWYVAGEHYRELRFVHLAARRDWRQGALDLYRPGGAPEGEAEEAWIIDFKTHRIGSDEVSRTALEYEIQAEVYRGAVTSFRRAAGKADPKAVRVAFHFTHPNVAVEV